MSKEIHQASQGHHEHKQDLQIVAHFILSPLGDHFGVLQPHRTPHRLLLRLDRYVSKQRILVQQDEAGVSRKLRTICEENLDVVGDLDLQARGTDLQDLAGKPWGIPHCVMHNALQLGPLALCKNRTPRIG